MEIKINITKNKLIGLLLTSPGIIGLGYLIYLTPILGVCLGVIVLAYVGFMMIVFK